ncbi:MAG: IgGFc-binding protein, partial [Deltaproteobacteria bacterium]|nr:IgGFc-binding protein [Deltaproteobacteria bacterium]
ARLLRPGHTLTGSYMASPWPTWGAGRWDKNPVTPLTPWMFYPGFVTVAAIEDGTKVTVTSSTHTEEGAFEADGGPDAGGSGALEPGEAAIVTLNRGDVLQVYSQRPDSSAEIGYCKTMGWEQATAGTCPPKNISQTCDAQCSVATADLTGTLVDADKPVAVFAGHACTYMPFNMPACDHMEEMMFPRESWGNSAVMTALVSPDGGNTVPSMYRVLAKENGTTLTFTPEVHAKVTLDAGKFVEFITVKDFVIDGTHPFYATQAMLSQNALGTKAGDPSMGSGVPVFQSRGAYSFLTPSTYTSNYLNVVATTGTTVSLDDVAVSSWQPIAGTSYQVARLTLQAGAHRAESQDATGFAITSYGYAEYTSYLYPGGMNVENFVE